MVLVLSASQNVAYSALAGAVLEQPSPFAKWLSFHSPVEGIPVDGFDKVIRDGVPVGPEGFGDLAVDGVVEGLDIDPGQDPIVVGDCDLGFPKSHVGS